MLQMQLQMQQQQMQQQMQYQQAQMQAQMQAYQQQMAVRQQAAQVQQEIASLQVRLQMLYSGAYTSNSTYNTGTIPYPTNYQNGTTLPSIGTVTPTNGGTQVTVPTNGR
jgi:3-mercaptopyruvate sulfurtransferase SseA